MSIFHWIIAALWLLLLAYWAIAAIGVKRSVDATARRKQVALRVSIVVLVIIALSVPQVRHALGVAQAHTSGAVSGVIGTILVGLGIGLAVLARAYLGRNWGTPMSRKETPELVTGGPYAFIRHPIYTGIFFAMLGSTIAESFVWVLPLLLFGAYFIYSARREEELMCRQFPEGYRAYMEGTKMFVPFVL